MRVLKQFKKRDKSLAIAAVGDSKNDCFRINSLAESGKEKMGAIERERERGFRREKTGAI